MTTPGSLGNLGYTPTIEPLLLTTGASFVQNIIPSGGAVFPSGTTAVINFTTQGGAFLTSWTGTVTPYLAAWNVPNSSADTIPVNTLYTMIVSYPTTPVTTYAWYEGTVQRP